MPDLNDLFRQVDQAENDIVALEQALVRIPSVNTGFMPTGDETPVCELARDFLAEDGIESEILESAPNRGNLIARLEGRSGNAGLMFMSHTDVVPVEDESKWRFPPFSATIADGRVFGRGATDCKGLLTAQLMAVRILKRNGIELEDGLILAAGADEEHGGRYGFGWLADNYPEKLAAPFAVNEGGGTPIEAAGALTYVLGVGEKGRPPGGDRRQGAPVLTPRCRGRGTNALYRLSRALSSIEGFEADRDTSGAIFDHLSTFAIEHKPSAENVDDIIAEIETDNPALRVHAPGLVAHDADLPTMVRGGIKSNSVPESIRLTCDVRTLPPSG